MTQDDLMKFCDLSYEKTKTPFSSGNYTYATNGHLLVRVNRLSDVPERSDAPPLDEIYKYFCNQNVHDEHISIPCFDSPAKKICSECGGAGKDYSCPECEGTGIVDLENDYNEYQADCKSCLGTKIISGVCTICDGVGYYFLHESYPIGDQFYNKHYLALIRALPGCAFAAGRNMKEPGHFTFDGGAGLLMPMKGDRVS